MPYELQTLERALDLLLELSSRQPLRLVDLTRLLGTNQTTVLRTLRVLEARGFVRRERGQEYLLGPRLIELGHASVLGINVLGLLRERARQLSTSQTMTVHIGMLRDDAVTIVAKVDAPEAHVTYSTLGTRMPLHATAAGKAALALLPPAERESALPPGALPSYTQRTITRHAALLADVEMTVRRGYSLEIEEYNAGFGCAGCAFVLERDLYTVSISGPVGPLPVMLRRGEELVRMVEHFLAEVGPSVRSLVPTPAGTVT